MAVFGPEPEHDEEIPDLGNEPPPALEYDYGDLDLDSDGDLDLDSDRSVRKPNTHSKLTQQRTHRSVETILSFLKKNII